MSDEPCECPEDGFCVRYNKHMRGRLRRICRGEVLTPEKCEAYRNHWLSKRRTLVGDVIHTVTKVTGIAAVVNLVSKIRKKPCPCAERRRKLNEAHAKRRKT